MTTDSGELCPVHIEEIQTEVVNRHNLLVQIAKDRAAEWAQAQATNNIESWWKSVLDTAHNTTPRLDVSAFIKNDPYLNIHCNRWPYDCDFGKIPHIKTVKNDLTKMAQEITSYEKGIVHGGIAYDNIAMRNDWSNKLKELKTHRDKVLELLKMLEAPAIIVKAQVANAPESAPAPTQTHRHHERAHTSPVITSTPSRAAVQPPPLDESESTEATIPLREAIKSGPLALTRRVLTYHRELCELKHRDNAMALEQRLTEIDTEFKSILGTSIIWPAVVEKIESPNSTLDYLPPASGSEITTHTLEHIHSE